MNPYAADAYCISIHKDAKVRFQRQDTHTETDAAISKDTGMVSRMLASMDSPAKDELEMTPAKAGSAFRV